MGLEDDIAQAQNRASTALHEQEQLRELLSREVDDFNGLVLEAVILLRRRGVRPLPVAVNQKRLSGYGWAPTEEEAWTDGFHFALTSRGLYCMSLRTAGPGAEDAGGTGLKDGQKIIELIRRADEGEATSWRIGDFVSGGVTPESWSSVESALRRIKWSEGLADEDCYQALGVGQKSGKQVRPGPQ